MTKINGTLNTVLSGSDIIYSSTTATLDVGVNLADTSTKDDGGWATHLNGQRNWTISVDGLYDVDGVGLSVADVLDSMIARTADTVIKFTTDLGNLAGWTGNGTFSDVSITGPNEEAMTYTFTITGNGQLEAIV